MREDAYLCRKIDLLLPFFMEPNQEKNHIDRREERKGGLNSEKSCIDRQMQKKEILNRRKSCIDRARIYSGESFGKRIPLYATIWWHRGKIVEKETNRIVILGNTHLQKYLQVGIIASEVLVKNYVVGRRGF